MDHRTTLRRVVTLPVIVAALGFFVDIYDLVLSSIVRVPGLKALGVSGKELTDYGVDLLNMQMAGMLVGGPGAAAAFVALAALEETFHKDLDCFEEFR